MGGGVCMYAAADILTMERKEVTDLSVEMQFEVLLNSQQYAYQPGRSTSDAVRDVVGRVLGHLEDSRQVAAIFCDLSRAFETIDHSLLLKKLFKYGVTGSFHKTISSFLENRKQRTYVLNSKSDLESTVVSDVPGYLPRGADSPNHDGYSAS
ncbi:uncharacterized protein LOC134801754 [Cydia splendana]|uniref:uncharacterized protein LOC134801754 n=1 Tax=Cydia splendana TaxID=1100963 RepID=UPI00300D601A